jgi:predicted phage terminase large subunit-like protein
VFTPEQLELLKGLEPKQIAKHSIAFFSKYYLSLDVPKHQKKWYDYCFRKRHLMLSPRDHGKTTVFCHAFPVWAICNIPNVRILLVSKTSRQSNKLLKTIRDELRNNELIKKDYGNLMLSDNKGPIWCVRTEGASNLKDPTVECVGAEGSITGGHFDIIICDDIIDDENTKTETRMEDLANWFYGTIGQLCEPHTQWFVSGTRKHYADIYQELIDNPLWQKQIDKAIITYPESWEYIYSTNEDGQQFISGVKVVGAYKVLWPEKWPIEVLLLDRQQTGSILFDREKQNDPSGMKGQFLKVDWLHYYKWASMPPLEDLVFYIGGDLAISESEKADETVFTLAGYHRPTHRIFYIDSVAGRWDFPTQQDKLKENYTYWAQQGMRAHKVLIENNVYQAALAQEIRKDTWIPAVGVRTVKDKVTKMISISPHFENESVLLRSTELCGVPEFAKQWVQFPFAEHDDRLDSFALIILHVALGIESNIGVVETDRPYDEIREDEAYEYLFCDCGEEYGTSSGVLPKKNGICDVCNEAIPQFPPHIYKVKQDKKRSKK